MAEPIIKYLGRSIEKLSIIFNDNSETSQTRFGHLVNIHCSDTLKELKVIQSTDDFFDSMRKPFRQMTDVSITGSFQKSNRTHEFDDLFPAMHHLYLDFDWDSKQIVRHFPHLIELDVMTAATHNFIPLFKRNPQIRKIKCNPIDTTEFLRIVNDNLPYLQQIDIGLSSFKGDRGPDVHFEHVTEVKMSDMRSKFRADKITFQKLDAFTLELDSYFDGREIGDEWIDFMENNRLLTKFILKKGYINAENLLRISTILSDLREVSFVCSNGTPLETIFAFLANNKNMSKFTFKYKSQYPAINSNDTLLRLNETLGTEWNVVYNDLEWSISLVRQQL